MNVQSPEDLQILLEERYYLLRCIVMVHATTTPGVAAMHILQTLQHWNHHPACNCSRLILWTRACSQIRLVGLPFGLLKLGNAKPSLQLRLPQLVGSLQFNKKGGYGFLVSH